MKRVSALPAHRVLSLATIVVLGVLITLALPLTFPAGGGPTGFDRFVDDRIHSALDAHHTVYRVLVTPSDAPIVLAVLLIGVLWYAWRRDWWRAGFLLIAPELVVAINTFALKYVWHRHLHHYLAYPSGHTVQFMAIATAFVLIVPTPRLRIGATVLAVVLLVCIAIGMIGFGYHYPTDILGGTATAVALVTAMYAALPGTLRRGPSPAAVESTPAQPDANPAEREANSAGLPANSVELDLSPVESDTSLAGLAANPAERDVNSAGPDASPARPDANSAGPDVNPAEPDTTPAGPDANSAEPGSNPAGSGANSAERETNSGQPGPN